MWRVPLVSCLPMARLLDYVELGSGRVPRLTRRGWLGLQKAFKVFDKENRGTIHPWELKHILSHFGEIMDEAEIDEYLAEADNKAPEMKPTGEKTGKINYVAFAGVMLDLSEEQVCNPKA